MGNIKFKNMSDDEVHAIIANSTPEIDELLERAKERDFNLQTSRERAKEMKRERNLLAEKVEKITELLELMAEALNFEAAGCRQIEDLDSCDSCDSRLKCRMYAALNKYQERKNSEVVDSDEEDSSVLGDYKDYPEGTYEEYCVHDRDEESI